MYKKLMFLISFVCLLGLASSVLAADLEVAWGETYIVSGTEEYDEMKCGGTVIIPAGATLILNDESDIDGDGTDGPGGSEYAKLIVDGGTFIMNERLNMGCDHDAYLIVDNGGVVAHDGDKITVPDNEGGEHRIIIIDGSMTAEEIDLRHDRDAKVILGCMATIETCNTDEDDSRDPAQWLADGALLCHFSCPNGVIVVTDLGGNCKEAICLWWPPPPPPRPWPPDGAVWQSVDVILCWYRWNFAFRYSAYLGTDPVAVENATIADPEWKGYYEPESMGLPYVPGECPYVPGECVDPDLALQNPITLQLWETYYWRVDIIHTPGSPTPPVSKGQVWSFTTGCDLFPGDINLDCVVNFADYAMMADDWREEGWFPDCVQP